MDPASLRGRRSCENEIKNSQAQHFWHSHLCNLFSRRRDRDTHCAFPWLRGEFSDALSTVTYSRMDERDKLCFMRGSGIRVRRILRATSQGNERLTLPAIFRRVMSREREIYARNVTGIRGVRAIFGRRSAKLLVFTVNYAKVWTIPSGRTSQRGSDELCRSENRKREWRKVRLPRHGNAIPSKSRANSRQTPTRYACDFLRCISDEQFFSIISVIHKCISQVTSDKSYATIGLFVNKHCSVKYMLGTWGIKWCATLEIRGIDIDIRGFNRILLFTVK